MLFKPCTCLLMSLLHSPQAMASLLRVRTVVQQTLARQDAERTNQFLHAASAGDVAKIRQVPRFVLLSRPCRHSSSCVATMFCPVQVPTIPSKFRL